MPTSTIEQHCFYVTDEKDIQEILRHAESISIAPIKAQIDISSELKKGQETLANLKSSLLKTYSKYRRV